MPDRMPGTISDASGTKSPMPDRPQGFIPIGGSQFIDPISALTGLIKDHQAAVQEIRNVSREVLAMTQKVSTFYGDSADSAIHARQVLGGQATSPAQQMAGQMQMDQMVAQQAVVRQNQAHRDMSADPSRPTPVAGQPTRQTESTEGMPAQRLPTSNDEAWNAFQKSRNYDMGALRQSAAANVYERVSALQIAEETAVGAGENTNIGGSVGGTVARAGAMSMLSKGRRAKVLGGVKDIAGEVAGGVPIGKSMLGKMGVGAAKVIGAPLAIAQGVDMVANFAERQRVENTKYQSILGGGQMDALKQRGEEKLSRARSYGILSGDQATELFQGVTQTGMKGERRSEAMDFAIQQYKELGVSIADSVKLVAIAAKSGTQNLRGLSTALKSVTQAARESGVNAQVMRENFAGNYEKASGPFGGDTGAKVAGALTAFQARLGPGFEDADFSGTLEESRLRRIAAQQGMSYNQLVGKGQGPGGNKLITRGVSKLIQGDTAGAITGEGMSMLAQAQQKAKGGKLSPEAIKKLSQKMLIEGGLDDIGGVTRRLARSTGIRGLDAGSAAELLVKNQLGVTPEAEMEEREKAARSTNVGKDKGRDRFNKLNKRLDTPETGLTTAVQSYGTSYLKKGKVSPTIEALLEADPTGQKTKIKVKGKGERGKYERVVSLQDAITHYGDQLNQGDVEIVEGEGAGSSVSDVTQLGDQSKKAKAAATKSGKRFHAENFGKEVGQSAREYGKDKAKKEQAGSVKIDASPELKRWLKINTSGSAFMSTTPNAAPDDVAGRTQGGF